MQRHPGIWPRPEDWLPARWLPAAAAGGRAEELGPKQVRRSGRGVWRGAAGGRRGAAGGGGGAVRVYARAGADGG